MSREIPLSQGCVALVDDEDYDSLIPYQWYAFRGSRSQIIYAARSHYVSNPVNGKSRTVKVYMHKQITGYAKTDHKNRNGLDNRRENLRSATQTQNNANIPKRKGLHSSRFKGVSWSPARSKWEAKTSVNGKTIHLGRYISEIDAAKAYDRAAVEYFGEFALLNFPEGE